MPISIDIFLSSSLSVELWRTPLLNGSGCAFTTVTPLLASNLTIVDVAKPLHLCVPNVVSVVFSCLRLGVALFRLFVPSRVIS